MVSTATLVGIIIVVIVVVIAIGFYVSSEMSKKSATKIADCLNWKRTLNPATRAEYDGQPSASLTKPGEFCVGRYHCVNTRWEGPDGPCGGEECMDPNAIPNEDIHKLGGCSYSSDRYRCVGECNTEALRKACRLMCENLLSGG